MFVSIDTSNANGWLLQIRIEQMMEQGVSYELARNEFLLRRSRTST